MTFSEGSYAKSLRWKRIEFSNERADVRDEVRLARREVDEAQVLGLERRDLAPWPGGRSQTERPP